MIGAGEKPEKQPHPLIMEEPFWIYAGSGGILVLGGLLKVLLAFNFLVDIPNFEEFQEYSTLKNLILGIIFLVCGIIILKQKRALRSLKILATIKWGKPVFILKNF